MRRRFYTAAAIVLLAGAAAGAEPGLLYRQDFNACPLTNDPALSSSWATNCNASLSNVTWKLWSQQNWAYHVLVRQIEDLGGGDVAVTVYDQSSHGWPAYARSLTAYAPASGVWPAWQNVVVTAYQKWSGNAPSGDEYSTGLILRGDSATGTGGVDVWRGSFYLVQTWDLPSGDTLRLIRVNNGTETNLAGVVTWKNGYTNFNDAARREGYLRVDIQNLGVGGDVRLDAIYSSDPQFKNPAGVIIVGSWTVSAANRILAGGTVGFAE